MAGRTIGRALGTALALGGLLVGARLAGSEVQALTVPAEGARVGVPKHLAPIPAATLATMAALGTDAAAPVLMRAFKKEGELEVWKRGADGRYVLLKTFPICRWSGQLGPKLRQGDRQVPEGFYPVARRQMNPNSSYYLSFDLGYPNAYDRARGGSGSALMVHGTCSSAGCLAMTDRAVGEIFAIAREAFAGGQAQFQFQSFPFRMSALNMARHRTDPNLPFWRQLKEGSDRFEATRREPAVGVAAGRYTFASYADPALEALAKQRLAAEETLTVALAAEGSAAIRTTYQDGGQHPSFAALLRRGVPLGDVSRPEALAFAGLETILIPARRRPPDPPAPVFVSAHDAGLAPETEPSLFRSAGIAEGATRLTLARDAFAPGGPGAPGRPGWSQFIPAGGGRLAALR